MNERSPTLRNLLERVEREPVVAPNNEEQPEYTAYAQGRISRHPQLSLMFRWADGSVRAFAYAYFCGAESSEPARGFVLDFSPHKIKISGRNLELLLRLVCEHHVAEIRQAERGQVFALAVDAAVIESIEIVTGAPPKSALAQDFRTGAGNG